MSLLLIIKKATNENSDKLGLLIYLWYDFSI